MQLPVFLNDPGSILVADTSVAISIIESGNADGILGAISNRVVVAGEVVAELELGRSKGYTSAASLQELVAENVVEVMELGEVGTSHFADLVLGTAKDTLDDGEAATIACALELGGFPLIDERKARSVCDTQYQNLSYGYTVDIFAMPEVKEALGTDGLALAVFNALERARMHVLPHHLEWVFNLVGAEKIVACHSLPYNVRQQAAAALRTGQQPLG